MEMPTSNQKNREYYKQYYANNSYKISNNKKKYYTKNSGIINAKKNQQFTCHCGGCYTKQQQARHNKTKLHQSYLFNQRVEQQYQLCCKLYAESQKLIA